MKSSLSLQEDFNSSMINSMPYGILVIDTDSLQVKQCNPSFRTLIAKADKKIVGKSVLDLSPAYQEGKIESKELLKAKLSALEKQIEITFYWWFSSFEDQCLITEIRAFRIHDIHRVALLVNNATDEWLTSIALKDIIREVYTPDAQVTLNNMVYALAKTFNLEFVYIAQPDSEKLLEAETLAISAEFQLIDNVNYDLTVAPCQELYKVKDVVIYDSDLKTNYSHNAIIMEAWNVDSYIGVPLWDVRGGFLGHFAACKRGKLEQTDLLLAFLKKYSAWAALQIERLNKEKELERLNKDKDRLLTILSHDLRGPIGGLETMLEMLTNGDLSREEFLELVVTIRQNIKGLRNNMEVLLEWTHRQSRQVKTVLSHFALATTIQSVFDLLGSVAANKNIKLVHQVPSTYSVLADENQINLVLRNLVMNALKFTKPGGEVRISAKEAADKIIVSLQDTGIGMADERLLGLFEHSHTEYGTEGEKGTGLGLLLCKDIIDQHNEKIWAESELGKGSVFCFTLSK